MARINIEDEFWDDIGAVTERLGNEILAIGYAVKFIKFAQRAHKNDRAIPKEEFRTKFHEALIGIFAVETEEGFVAKDAETHFGWLRKRAEAGAKGGRARNSGELREPNEALKRKKASGLVNLAVNSGKLKRSENCQICGVIAHTQGHHENYDQPYDVVWVCSGCHGTLHTKEINSLRTSKLEANEANEKPLPLPLPLKSLKPNTNTAHAATSSQPVKIYCDAYKNRYGHSPEIGGKQAGILTRFGKNHPAKCRQLIEGYLAMPEITDIEDFDDNDEEIYLEKS